MSEKIRKIIDNVAFIIVFIALIFTISGFIVSQRSVAEYRDVVEQYRARQQQYEAVVDRARAETDSAIEYNHGIGECLDRQQSSIASLRETLQDLRKYYTEMESRLCELSSIYNSIDSDIGS